MHPDLERLTQLQEADREIKRLNDEIAALPKRVAAIEQKLASSKAKVEKARAAIKAVETVRRKHEAEIQGLQQKVSKYREQSLEVKTNEQYRALMNEISFAEQEIRRLEDKILEGMLEVETNEKQAKSAEADLKAETAEIEKEKTEARARTTEDEQQLVEWNSKRTTLCAAIPEHLLRHYDRLMKLRGTALAEARGQKCSVCQVMLRPQVYNDVRAGQEVFTCDSCQRFLFYDPAHEPEVVEGPKSARAKHPRPEEKGWYHLADDTGAEFFVAFNNRPRSCTMHKYSAENGHIVAPPESRSGDFQTAFAAEIERGTWLFDVIENQDLENWEHLPPEVLDILKRELRIIQVATEQAPATQ